MDISWKRISEPPMILLVTSFAAGAVLTATLTLGGEAAINKRDPIFDALSGQTSAQPGWSGQANFAVRGASPVTAQAISDTSNVAGLGELLPGLEAKVAANPDDADLQVLLAQTYVELGRREKATELLDKLDRQFPEDDRIPFIRARALMESDATADLRKAIHLFERDQACGKEANMAKLLASEASWQAAECCMQTHGGYAFAEEYDVERKYREARLYQIAPISTNLILSYIAEHVLELPRSY